MKYIINPVRLFILFLLVLSPAYAHVGSPGVIYEGEAGPYRIMVNVNPPDVIPGTATVQVYVTNGGVEQVLLKPIYWFSGADGAPKADEALPLAASPGQYEGLTWLMSNGTASIEVKVSGELGEGTALVPVMAMSTAQKEMDPALGWILGALGLFLVILMITIIGVSVSDAVVPPGDEKKKTGHRKTKGMVVAAAFLCLILYGGMSWWNNWAEDYRRYMYKPYQANTKVVTTDNGRKMIFEIDSAYKEYRQNYLPISYLIPDHGKLMHMFLVREGSLDAFAHLHPVRTDSLTFEVDLPPLPNGRYFVFGDIVRGNGFHETITDTMEIMGLELPVSLTTSDENDGWQPSDPDDTYIISNPVLPNQVQLAAGDIVVCGKPGIRTPLPDGSSAIWEHEGESFQANRLYPMTFSILDPDGEPAELEPYMGMMGHAVVMKHDGSVYIHLHPVGNYSSASQDLIKRRMEDDSRLVELPSADQFRDSVDQVVASIKAMSEEERNDYLMELMGHTYEEEENGEHAGHATVTFPYAFPEPGNYRIWIQMKRNGQVLNTAFDAVVE
ncbi:hypothetical protein OKW21_000451 [Catalinimonas alkaloidigena]|uniref:hypothetical protein n=1 Tax=Catalinimonas alkaloidigena TaxID=1075417 RepID=UPI00240733FE|nr:hypothetical protein [Catalinimonas alkaloidigena]MDF9795188.1 hypothetical protein [Catalinimonas alkaloidigena]